MGAQLILHLGVIDIPYAGELGTTTGDVASFLETKYGVMQRFFDLHENDIATVMTDGLRNTIEDIVAGAPATLDPYGTAMNKIGQEFRVYIDIEEITKTGVPGVPTQAALIGKSKRFKRQRGPRRPSFIDSGDYQQSFSSWVEP